MEVNSETSSRATALATFMARPQVAKLWEFGKLGAQVGVAQVAIQAIGFVSGILVIRLLPTQEYALYTLANTMLGTMTILADGGIATGVMSEGGKVWQDKKKLGAVLHTGMELRKKFALGSLLIATPILLYLLQHHGASWLMAGLITLSLIPAFFANLSGKLLEIPLKLKQDIAPLQKIQVASNAGRLGLLGLTLFIYPFAGVAILCAGVAQVWANVRLRKVSSHSADRLQNVSADTNRKILKIVKRSLPTAIYFSISGQLSIWILSLLGTQDSVARIGALTRLTIALSLLTVLVQTLIVPRFARLTKDYEILRSTFLKVQATLLLALGALYIPIYALSDYVLLILGESYDGLTPAFKIQCLTALLGVYIASTANLNTSRGFILHPGIHIPLNLVIITMTVSAIQPTNLMGALQVDLARACVAPLVLNFTFFRYANKPS